MTYEKRTRWLIIARSLVSTPERYRLHPGPLRMIDVINSGLPRIFVLSILLLEGLLRCWRCSRAEYSADHKTLLPASRPNVVSLPRQQRSLTGGRLGALFCLLFGKHDGSWPATWRPGGTRDPAHGRAAGAGRAPLPSRPQSLSYTA
jgi:hypothetical protein